MKHALVDGQLIPATPHAPAMAVCPNCGGLVALRNRQGTHFWRHVQLPRDGCRPPNPESVVTGDDDLKRWTRRVGDLLIELFLDAPEGPHLKLRSLSAEKAGEPTELVIPLREVRPLAAALLDAAAVAGRSAQDLSVED